MSNGTIVQWLSVAERPEIPFGECLVALYEDGKPYGISKGVVTFRGLALLDDPDTKKKFSKGRLTVGYWAVPPRIPESV